MRKWLLCLVFVMLLSGCGAKQTFETVDDELLQPVMAEVGTVELSLPPEASAQTMLAEKEDKLYFCDGYTLAVQIMDCGDLNRTCRELCGYDVQMLNIVETAAQGQRRYDWVWTTVSEEGDCVGRAAVIDDGSYHYCVSLQTQAQLAGEMEEAWGGILRSFGVSQY